MGSVDSEAGFLYPDKIVVEIVNFFSGFLVDSGPGSANLICKTDNSGLQDNLCIIKIQLKLKIGSFCNAPGRSAKPD